mmetsp:Transcript_14779/g.35675  ORF Transcript_14779/g.35675 Transcript_14779/m.35675 type:complete len:138 (+) Transcript_14779:1781-2194(+)
MTLIRTNCSLPSGVEGFIWMKNEFMWDNRNDTGSLQQCIQGIEPLMKSVRTVRMLGSSAVFLPWVANGRLTAYWTPDECAWDIAAGALMVQEAGGRCTDILGKEYNLRTRNLIASNGKIHDSLLKVLREDASLGPLV